MKILQVSNYYYPHIGGVEQVARDCVSALSGCESKVLCFNHDKGTLTDTVDGVEIVRVGCFAKIASQSLSFSYGKMLKKTVKEFEPEVIIFHYPNPFAAHYLLKILKKRRDIKLILYWHLDITKQKILGKLFNGQTKRLLRRAEKVVATSPNYIEGSKFLSAYADKCAVIPCCVPENRQKNESGAKKIRSEYGEKIILFALGRHVPYKGMENLVRASKLLDDRFAVIIGGEGELTESLKEMAKGDDKVLFTGRLSDGEVSAYLGACDIFCFPSVTKNEAFGIALAEAMSYAKPAVTFTIPGSGVNYVSLNGVTGIEVENGNVNEYARAINLIATDAALREKLGAAAAERVKELFTYEKFADNINDLVNKIN